MLKQQFAENQQLSTITAPSTVVMQTGQNAAKETRAEGLTISSAASHLLSPLYLSRRQIATAFAIPLGWTLAMAGMQWRYAVLPDDLRYNENWAYLHVVVFWPLPMLLCLWLGYYLRNRRIAALSGALAGVMFYLTTLFNFRLVTDHVTITDLGEFIYEQHMEFRLLPINFTEIITAVLLSTFLTLVAAVLSQTKYGRRTMPDKNSNR